MPWETAEPIRRGNKRYKSEFHLGAGKGTLMALVVVPLNGLILEISAEAVPFSEDKK